MEDQDIVQEILLRLPVKSLGRCKSLSKHWYNFISYNPAFRKSYRSRNIGKCVLMMGIFFSKELPYAEEDDDVKFIHTCARGKPVAAHNKKRKQRDDAQTATTLVDGTLSFLGHRNINVLASANGALLVSTELIRPENYFICNPITKQYIALPTTEPYGHYCTHGFICSTRYPDFEKEIEYKVVRGECFHFSTTVYLSILSSEFPDEWRVIVLTFETPLCLYHHFPTIISEQGLIYTTGVMESQKGMCLVIVDESKRDVELEDLPYEKESRSDQFGQSNQRILYAASTDTHIKIWERNDGTRQWSLKHILGPEILRLIRPLHTNEKWTWSVPVEAFHPTNPNIVFCHLYGSKKDVSYDWENSRWEEICGHKEQGWKFSYHPFPYTCDVVFGPHLFFDS